MLPKNLDDFLETLRCEKPDELWPEALKALWYDGKGDWHASHEIAQDIPTAMGSWIHAYLHRKEGDDWNAGYWYRRANRDFGKVKLEAEFKELVETVLSTEPN